MSEVEEEEVFLEWERKGEDGEFELLKVGEAVFLECCRIGEDGSLECGLTGGRTVIPNLEITWTLLHWGQRNFPRGCKEALLEEDSIGDFRPPDPFFFSNFLRSVSTCEHIAEKFCKILYLSLNLWYLIDDEIIQKTYLHI